MRFQKKINWKQLYTLFNPNSAYTDNNEKTFLNPWVTKGLQKTSERK